jgi:hypothetical protein
MRAVFADTKSNDKQKPNPRTAAKPLDMYMIAVDPKYIVCPQIK